MSGSAALRRQCCHQQVETIGVDRIRSEPGQPRHFGGIVHRPGRKFETLIARLGDEVVTISNETTFEISHKLTRV